MEKLICFGGDTVELDLRRYDELLRAETQLDAVIRVVATEPSYNVADYVRIIVGEKYSAEKEGDNE